MRTDIIDLPPDVPGSRRSLTALRFGQPGARPLAYVQAALHADEIPGMMAAHHLRAELERLEADGQIVGEVLLVPVANPIGLGQRVLGSKIGRFDLSDGLNFNRGFPALGPAAAKRVEGRLTDDASRNVAIVRDALLEALWRPSRPRRRPSISSTRCCGWRCRPTSCSTCIATARPRCTSTP